MKSGLFANILVNGQPYQFQTESDASLDIIPISYVNLDSIQHHNQTENVE